MVDMDVIEAIVETATDTAVVVAVTAEGKLPFTIICVVVAFQILFFSLSLHRSFSGCI